MIDPFIFVPIYFTYKILQDIIRSIKRYTRYSLDYAKVFKGFIFAFPGEPLRYHRLFRKDHHLVLKQFSKLQMKILRTIHCCHRRLVHSKHTEVSTEKPIINYQKVILLKECFLTVRYYQKFFECGILKPLSFFHTF